MLGFTIVRLYSDCTPIVLRMYLECTLTVGCMVFCSLALLSRTRVMNVHCYKCESQIEMTIVFVVFDT